jgi:hypothetical protein
MTHTSTEEIATRVRCIGDGSWCMLMAIHEADGLWLCHGLGIPGVKLFPMSVTVADPTWGGC